MRTAPRTYLRRHPPAVTGLVGALAFFVISVTPSLLPRAWVFQALVSGIAAAIGYAVGALVGWTLGPVVRWATRGWRPSREHALAAWWGLGLVASVVCTFALAASARWQTQLRASMGVVSPGPNYYLLILGISVAMLAVLVVAARLVRACTRGLGHPLSRWVPAPLAMVLSSLSVLGLALWAWSGLLYPSLLHTANLAFGAANAETKAGSRPPTSTTHAGGPGSLVSWESLGREGRQFVGRGPDLAQLDRFSDGDPAVPVRTYVGLDSGGTPEQRARLAVRELERAGGFERGVLVVATSTGTGWVDPAAIDSLEYLHGGDSAIVSMQYSYLPSWLSFLADQQQAIASGRALFDAVYDEWRGLDVAIRPELVVYGESLGVVGGAAAFAGLEDLAAKVDGALWVGPPEASALLADVVGDRDVGSPSWQPTYDGGETVRYWTDAADSTQRYESDWEEPRMLVLQHPSDPIAWWSPELLWEAPTWLREPRAEHMPGNLRWYPAVTFWQVTADLVRSRDVPAGFGHRYTAEHVDAWLAVAPPDDLARWSPADLAALRAVIAGRAR